MCPTHLPLCPLCTHSGLEDSRLNFIEQHAERLGLDAGRLEGARVAASQGGLAGETLDLCARQGWGCTGAGQRALAFRLQQQGCLGNLCKQHRRTFGPCTRLPGRSTAHPHTAHTSCTLVLVVSQAD